MTITAAPTSIQAALEYASHVARLATQVAPAIELHWTVAPTATGNDGMVIRLSCRYSCYDQNDRHQALERVERALRYLSQVPVYAPVPDGWLVTNTDSKLPVKAMLVGLEFTIIV